MTEANPSTLGIGAAGFGPDVQVFRLGPLSLDAFDLPSAAARIVGEARSGTPCIVVTPNIHHLRLAARDQAYRAILESAKFRLADGWPLIASSRVLRPALPGRIAGIDLVDAILNASEHLRIAILGGPPGAAEQLRNKLTDRHQVVYLDPLPAGQWRTATYLDRLASDLAKSRPSLTLIGIGAPRQEELAEVLEPYVSGPIICCGASIEVLGGMTPRAPSALRASGLEWAFRLAHEPRRLGPRYLTAGAVFVGTLAREATGRLSMRRDR